MKVLKTVLLDEIPAHGSGREGGTPSPNESLYQDVLRLDGAALPVEYESADAALRFAHSCRVKTSRAVALGIKVIQRGKIVYLCRKDA